MGQTVFVTDNPGTNYILVNLSLVHIAFKIRGGGGGGAISTSNSLWMTLSEGRKARQGTILMARAKSVSFSYLALSPSSPSWQRWKKQHFCCNVGKYCLYAFNPGGCDLWDLGRKQPGLCRKTEPSWLQPWPPLIYSSLKGTAGKGRNRFGRQFVARQTVRRHKVVKAGCRKGEMSLGRNVSKAK